MMIRDFGQFWAICAALPHAVKSQIGNELGHEGCLSEQAAVSYLTINKFILHERYIWAEAWVFSLNYLPFVTSALQNSIHLHNWHPSCGEITVWVNLLD